MVQILEATTLPSFTKIDTGTDDAHNDAECSNRGVCDRTSGTCICEDSRFEGGACERKSCPDACNGRGRCQHMRFPICSVHFLNILITSVKHA